MKFRLLHIGIMIAALLAIPTFGQSTTITASKIQSDLSGTLLASGYLELTPVNARMQPTGFTSGSGGQVLPNVYFWPITNGAISGVVVPDTADATPSNVGYAVTITDASKRPIYIYKQAIYPTGSTWSFDSWSPTTTVIASPATAVISGGSTPTGTCTAPSLYYTPTSLYMCVGTTWTLLSSGSGGGSGGITAITGDGTASGTGSVSLTVTGLNGVQLSGLSTGLLKNTTSTGKPSIAVPGTDYEAPLGFTPLAPANNLSDLANVTTARTNLGLGSAATQASSAFDASGAASAAETAAQTSSLQKANNLSDVANAATARTNLGLGSAATEASSAFDSAGAASAAQTAAEAASMPSNATINLTSQVTGVLPAANLPAFNSSAAGIVPSSGGGTANYLRADGTWDAIANPDAITNYGASGLPVTYGNVTDDSNTVTVQDASSWVNGEGIYIPAVSSDAGSPDTGVTCDHVSVSGNTLTMLTSGGSACDAGWTSSTNSLPILHYKMTNGSISSTSNILSLTSAATFANGQGIRVAGAGISGADLICPKITVSGTTVTLYQSNGSTACDASTTVSGGAVYHDDTQAVKNAIAAGGPVYAPSGSYYLSSEVDLPNAISFHGDGLQNSIFVVDEDTLNAVVLKSSGITVRDLALIASEDFTPTSGTLLSFCDGSSTCFNDNITRVNLYGGWTDFQLLNKSIQGSVTYSTLHNPKHEAIYLDNPIPYGDINFDGLQAQTCSTAGCTTATGIQIDAADANSWNSVKINGFAPNLSITGSLGEVDHQRFNNVSFEGTGSLSANAYLMSIQKLGSYAVNDIQFNGGEFEINQTDANGFYVGPGVQGVQLNNMQMWGEGSASSSTSCVDVAGTIVTITGDDISQCGDAIRLEASASNTTITSNLLYTTSGWGINALGTNAGLSQTANVYSGNTAGTENLGSGPTVVANWYMNDGSGSTFVNQISGNNATTSNVSWTTSSGFPGSVASFNGTSSEATAVTAAPTSFTNTQAFSACVWINGTSFSNNPVLLRNLQNVSAANGWQITVAAGGTVGLYIINSVTASNYLNVHGPLSTLTTGVRHQICATYSGNGLASGTAIYVDGVSQSLTVASNTLNGSSASTQPLLIGWDGADINSTFTGVMGDAEVWSGALSSAQVESLYTAGPQ